MKLANTLKQTAIEKVCKIALGTAGEIIGAGINKDIDYHRSGQYARIANIIKEESVSAYSSLEEKGSKIAEILCAHIKMDRDDFSCNTANC